MSDDLIEQELEAREREMRDEYRDALVDVSTRRFDDHAELWVYVGALDRYERINARCQEVTKEYEARDLPIWVFAKTWTGPWPGGDSEQDIRRRRKEFMQRVRSRSDGA